MRRLAIGVWLAILCCAQAVYPEDLGGSVTQLVDATPYRGKTVRLSSWIKAESQPASGQLWLRVERPNQTTGLFGDLSDQPVKSDEWTRSEITLTVSPDAATLRYGVLSIGGGAIRVRNLSLLVIKGAEPLFLAADPLNQGFAEGATAGVPSNWKVLAEGSEPVYRAEVSHRGCHVGPPCALLTATAKAGAGSSGALLQNFAAANYRGKTVRFRALVRLQGVGKEDHARLILRTGRPGETLNPANLEDHLDYREIRGQEWMPAEIVRMIDEDVHDLSIGVMLAGKGRVWLDEVSFAIVPGAGAALPVQPLSPATAVSVPPPNDWPALPKPAHEEQKLAINAASRRAATYIHDLPNFLCTLLIHRAENLNSSGWKGRDVLNVQLGFADGVEHYKLLTVDNKATSRPYRSVGGAVSEGDFGSVLAEIFRPRSAQFYWDHWASLRQRVVQVYRYQIAQPKSVYELQFAGARGALLTTVTAHHGYVYIDRDSSLILRIEQVADPPAGFPLRSASTVIDYDWNEVGGKLYLLPLRAEVSMGASVLRSLNVVEFRDSRKFAAESAIRFDEP